MYVWRCRDVIIEAEDIDTSGDVTWTEWKTVTKERVVKGVMKNITLTVKKNITGILDKLVDVTSDLIERLKRHEFIISHQFLFFRNLRQTLSPNVLFTSTFPITTFAKWHKKSKVSILGPHRSRSVFIRG